MIESFYGRDSGIWDNQTLHAYGLQSLIFSKRKLIPGFPTANADMYPAVAPEIRLRSQTRVSQKSGLPVSFGYSHATDSSPSMISLKVWCNG